MKTSTKVLFLISILYFLPVLIKAQGVDSVVNYVDSRIGTYFDASNCVIGPQLPFGSINPSPQTPNGSMDGYNPFEPIRGFGQLHVSGTGWGKYGQIFISPQIGLAVSEASHDSPKSNETACPYEYGVNLTRYNIRTEFVPSHHSAIYRFVFPQSKNANILIDLSHNIPMDIATNVGGTISQGTIDIDSANSKISGFGKYSGGFGIVDYLVYFTASFSKKPDSVGTWKNGIIQHNWLTSSIININDSVGAYLKFQTKANDTVYMRIAVSFKSIDQAEIWLNHEIPTLNYDSVKLAAKDSWNNELSKIKIETDSLAYKTIFYTAMYHSMLMPRNRTNDMHGFAEGVPVWDDEYAIWDTWRSLFPLMCLINPAMVAGNVNSFIERFKLNKMVKDAYMAGYDMCEEQGGNDPDNIIADAYIKGIDSIDWNDAYSIIKNDADNERAGFQGIGNCGISNLAMDSYKTNGWIPSGIMSCSKTLEYSYNDFCAAQMAKGLGKTDDYIKYYKRSKKWINLWNTNAKSNIYEGFIVPKNTDGTFVNINLEMNWGSWENYFYEGNSWTYSMFVPHQFSELVWISGGKLVFAKKLHYAFTNYLIDYSNEPAFLAVYAFIYAGRPDLASYWVRKLLLNGYSLIGYPGNEDSGAMSSWYIFNSMGFFPNAGQNIYYLTGSLFKKVTLELANNKQIIIESENASPTNLYVQSCTVNGNIWDKAWISHDSIKNGAIIKFVMGAIPSTWAKNDSSLDFTDTSIIIGVRELQESKSFKNFNSYPNPFFERTYLNVSVPENIKTAQLKIFNSEGIVNKLITIQKHGDSVIEISGADLKSGFYFFALEYDGICIGSGKLAKL